MLQTPAFLAARPISLKPSPRLESRCQHKKGQFLRSLGDGQYPEEGKGGGER